MRSPEQVLKALNKHGKVSDYKFERLYRILFNEEMFHVAYQRIYAKPGNMTPGTDGKTINRMSLQRINKVIASLRDESYKPNPAKRIYIPKKNGKKRPLGIPSFEDKLVQEVVRMILEAVYEEVFANTSHGFRPNRSCHTALTHIQKTFTGTKWFVEGDIKGFFDNIDHNVLIATLRKRIADDRFLRLIRKLLNAGYIEDWKFHNTNKGTPQGGNISPILANIYLDNFDKYMEEYALRFNKGKERHITKEYKQLSDKMQRILKSIKNIQDADVRLQLRDEYEKLRRERQKIESRDSMDETYRRLRYVRYADDFLIGVIGSKAECVKIKSDITKYMEENLKLELSQEKTLITNAQKPAKFLGFDVSVRKSDAIKRDKNNVPARYYNGKIVLKVAIETVRNKLEEYSAIRYKVENGRQVWFAKFRGNLMKKKIEDIVAAYNSEIRGFYNYYCIANNVAYALSKFGYIMEYSMYHTIAGKTNSTVSKVIDKYKVGNDIIVPYQDAKGKLRYRKFYNEGFKRKPPMYYTEVNDLSYTIAIPQPTLTERLDARTCELCGKVGPVVMRHVRKLNQLKGKTECDRLMLFTTFASGRTEVALVKGSISIIPQGSTQEQLIEPGQLAHIEQKGNNISIYNVDLTPYIAWNEGRLIFENRTLENIVEILEHWYNVNISFGTSELKQLRFTGNMDRYATISPILKAIARTTNLQIKIEGREILITDN